MIAAPGIYDIDIEEYHSQRCCVGPSASSSSLRTIIHECPARFYAYSDLNPKPIDRKDKKALNFGSAAHALMLGEPAFDSRFFVSPFETFNANPGKKWYDDWKAAVDCKRERRTLIRPSEQQIIVDMVAAQRANTDCNRAFIEGAPERSIIWKDEETGIWLKARPDWLPSDPAKRLVTEYKTALTNNPRKLAASVFEYGYEMQAALVLDGVEKVLGVQPCGFAHIVQEKDPPYLTELKLFAPEQIDYGFRQVRKALRIFARCVETGVWPGWTVGPSYYQTPYYIAKSMESFDDDIGNGTAESYTGADYLAAG